MKMKTKMFNVLTGLLAIAISIPGWSIFKTIIGEKI